MESKRAKKDQKEREEIAKRSAPIDLTVIDTTSGHMNQPASRRTWDIEFPTDDVGSGYTGDESELASPINRKRKYGAATQPNLIRNADSDEEPFPTLEQLQYSARVKEEEPPHLISQVDLYDVSDRETDRKEQGPGKRARLQFSQPKQFNNPLNIDIPFSRSIAQCNLQFPIRSEIKAASFKTRPPESKERSTNRGGFLKGTYNISSPESDSDYVEIIRTSNRPKQPLPRSQRKSLAK
jgi:hypothetical protein